MKPSLYRFLGGAAFLGLGLVCADLAADGLSRNSPFIPAGGQSGPAAATENSPLELRGIMTTASGNVYGLFDPVKRQSSWVKLNEAGNDYTVRTFDAANDAVTVEYQGRVLTLALKTAKIETMAPSSLPQPVAVNPTMRTNGNNPPALSPTPVDEAKRLESVAAEVRRRRALRQSAGQQPGPGQPTPMSSNAPTLPAPQNPPPNRPSVPPR
jgi:hypothetical protein